MVAGRRASRRLALAAAVALMAGRPSVAEQAAPPPAAPDTKTETGEPETRAENWRALREEKRAHIAARKPSRIEKTLLAIEKAERPSLLDFNVLGAYPRVLNPSRGSWPAAGVRFWRPGIGGTPLDVHGSAFYSLRRYEFYDLQLGRLPHPVRAFPPRSTSGDDVHELGNVRVTGPPLTAYATLRYQHEPQTSFYGLGAASPSVRTNYLYQHATYEGMAGYAPSPRLALRVRASLKQVFIGPGQDDDSPTTQAVFDDTTAPGLARQPDFLHLGAYVLLDGRDEPGRPHRGAMLAVGWDGFDDLRSSSYRFDRFTADARAFLPLGSTQRVLALRARVSSDQPAAGSVVPFYFQETLGGGHNMRGFATYRFRGSKLVLGQAEYRWEAWPALELALFVDAGRVFTADEGLSLSDLEHDWGFGVRLKTWNATLVHFDTAFSREGTRAVLRLGSSF